jgi:hypothetical protein
MFDGFTGIQNSVDLLISVCNVFYHFLTIIITIEGDFQQPLLRQIIFFRYYHSNGGTKYALIFQLPSMFINNESYSPLLNSYCISNNAVILSLQNKYGNLWSIDKSQHWVFLFILDYCFVLLVSKLPKKNCFFFFWF